MVHARAEIGDQLQARSGIRDQVGIDRIGDGRDQHVAIGHGGGQLLAAELFVALVELCLEQRGHPLHHGIGQFAGDDHPGVQAAAWIDHDHRIAASLRVRQPAIARPNMVEAAPGSA
ncbi:hypothetical protein GCM10020258_27690 [Sphingomonas yabuuchiae]